MDHISGLHTFNWIEYAVFISMLVLSTLIGIYFGCYKGNQNTVAEYLLGGRKMGIFPVTMSLIASHISGITLLGVPSEIYMYGTQYCAIFFTNIVVTLMIIYFYIPVFYNLQLNSIYEYLELRFSYGVRVLASAVFAVSLILYIPLVIYVPSLAFNQVTGVSVHVISPIICVICIFYTTFGGLRAVVWTDAVQNIFTFASVLIIIFLGCKDVGGVTEIFRMADEGKRLEMFNLDPDPFKRHTFWTVSIGATFAWIASLAVNPGAMQRFIAVPSENKATRVMVWGCFGIMVVKALSIFTGLIIYAKYNTCDPIATKAIQKSGQLLPYYVMDIAGQYPGLTGLFISGVVSAALSTMSASLNTVAGTIYEDFVLIRTKQTLSEATAACVMKAIVFFLGVVCVLLVFVVEKLGAILQMTMSLSGVTHGALVYIFSVGMFFPWVNAKGAIAGAVSSFVVMAWIVVGAQIAILDGKLEFPGKITSVRDCPEMIRNMTFFSGSELRTQTYTDVGTPVIASEDIPLIYRVSYVYYCMIGTVVGLAVGLPVSFLTGPQDLHDLNPKLLVPQIRRFMKNSLKEQTNTIKEQYSLVPIKRKERLDFS